jgi:putative tryptophan/tyrosine transport system substrate-binding protein
MTGATSVSRGNINAFRNALEDAGYMDGKNVAFDFRWANTQREMQELAADMIQRHVHLIVASGGSNAAQGAKAATDTVPIVMVGGPDPVKIGLAKSLNRPGGNVTGVTLIHNQLASKRLELLHDLVPEATTIGYLVPGNGRADPETQEFLDVAAQKGRELIVIACRNVADFEVAFEQLSQQHTGGLIVSAFPLAFNNRNKVIALAAQYKIPTIYAQTPYAYEGGLMSYEGRVSMREVVNQYVVRILKGEKPADLPIQQPSKFDLVLNLRTAKTLGISVPSILVATADRVIE